MATSEGIPSSIDIEFLELNDNPYIILCGKTLYPESEIQALLTGNYRKPIIDGTVSQGEGTAS